MCLFVLLKKKLQGLMHFWIDRSILEKWVQGKMQSFIAPDSLGKRTGCLSSSQENEFSYFNQIHFQEGKHCDIIFSQYVLLCTDGLATGAPWAYRSSPFMICSCVPSQSLSLSLPLPPSHVLGLQYLHFRSSCSISITGWRL